MAVVKNLTGDTLALFRADAPPVDPGGEVTLRDEVFAEVGPGQPRAWPKSTWDVVTPPEGYIDASTDDAWLWVAPPDEDDGEYDPGAHTVEEVTEYLAAADEGERVRVIAVEAAGKARKTITEWSEE